MAHLHRKAAIIPLQLNFTNDSGTQADNDLGLNYSINDYFAYIKNMSADFLRTKMIVPHLSTLIQTTKTLYKVTQAS